MKGFIVEFINIIVFVNFYVIVILVFFYDVELILFLLLVNSKVINSGV